MAEARLLRKKASRDERLAQLTDRSALLFVLSIPHLDVEGRMIGLPETVRGIVVPAFARARPEDWTDLLVAGYIFEWTSTVARDGRIDPLVLWYATGGESVLAFRGFAKNQTVRRDREAPSRLPAPPPELLEQPALASAHATFSATPGLKEKVQGEELSTGLSVAPARARGTTSESLRVAQTIEASLAASVQRATLGDLRPGESAAARRLPIDDLEELARQLRGEDAGTAHQLRVWQRRGCGEREFAIARESLERRRLEQPALVSEARFFCSELARLLREHSGTAA